MLSRVVEVLIDQPEDANLREKAYGLTKNVATIAVAAYMVREYARPVQQFIRDFGEGDNRA